MREPGEVMLTMRPERCSRITLPAALQAMASAVTLSASVRVQALNVAVEKRLDHAIAGIVDQDVDAAPAIDDLFHRGLRRAFQREVADDLLDLGATSRISRAVSAIPVAIDVDDRDGAAARGQLDRHLAAEAAGSAGDQRPRSASYS